jgi:hypothetical protein
MMGVRGGHGHSHGLAFRRSTSTIRAQVASGGEGSGDENRRHGRALYDWITDQTLEVGLDGRDRLIDATGKRCRKHDKLPVTPVREIARRLPKSHRLAEALQAGIEIAQRISWALRIPSTRRVAHEARIGAHPMEPRAIVAMG